MVYWNLLDLQARRNEFPKRVYIRSLTRTNFNLSNNVYQPQKVSGICPGARREDATVGCRKTGSVSLYIKPLTYFAISNKVWANITRLGITEIGPFCFRFVVLEFSRVKDLPY